MMFLLRVGLIVLAVISPVEMTQTRRTRSPASPLQLDVTAAIGDRTGQWLDAELARRMAARGQPAPRTGGSAAPAPPPRVDITAAVGDRTGQRLNAKLARRMAAPGQSARRAGDTAAPAAPPPPRMDVTAAIDDRTGQRLDAELARRLAIARAPPDLNLAWPNLTMNELDLDDDLFDWLPDEPDEADAAGAPVAPPDATRRLAHVKWYYHKWYHTNYAYNHPPDDDVVLKMQGMMREKLYDSRAMIEHVKPLFEKYSSSLKLRFAFVFRRLDQLILEMMQIFSYSWHFKLRKSVSNHMWYHEHLLRRHVDIVYIVERTVHMYNWYKERERRLKAVMAARLTTPAVQPTFD